jgi:hypothetical protein
MSSLIFVHLNLLQLKYLIIIVVSALLNDYNFHLRYEPVFIPFWPNFCLTALIDSASIYPLYAKEALK